MATHTIELRHLLQTGYDIGLEDYPIPNFADETWRKALNEKIVKHYYFREICDVPDRFKHFLNVTMNEIMPVKVKLYEALADKFTYNTGISFKEIYDYTHTEIGERNGDSASTVKGTTTDSETSNDSSNSYSLNVGSNTPGKLLNVENEIEANTYASNATKQKGNDSSNSKTDSTMTQDSITNTTSTDETKSGKEANYVKTIEGVYGKAAFQLFNEYAQTIRNIDLEVIDALATCFMGIF